MKESRKRYTIKFSYAGINQYADFYEVNGVLVNPHICVDYSRGDIPDISECKTIKEALELIKSFSWMNKAEIEKINGLPVFYHKKTQELVKTIEEETIAFFEVQANKFFNAEIKPLLIKNKWFIGRSAMCGMLVLIEKDKKGEWNNVRNEKKEKEFEYICKRFLSAINNDVDRFIVAAFLNLVEDKLKDFYVET